MEYIKQLFIAIIVAIRDGLTFLKESLTEKNLEIAQNFVDSALALFRLRAT